MPCLLREVVSGVSLIGALNSLPIILDIKGEHSSSVINVSVVQASHNTCSQVEPGIPNNAKDRLI